MNEQSLETRVMLLEERLKEMEKTLTTLNPYLRVGPTQGPTFEWYQQVGTGLLPVILTGHLNPKQVQENGKRNEK